MTLSLPERRTLATPDLAPPTAGIHPDAEPIILDACHRAGIPVRRLGNGVAGQRRYVFGAPGGSLTAGIAVLPPPREATPPPEPLTRREFQVLCGMDEGKRNREIGLALGIAEATVKSRSITLFRKLGVRDRAQAVGVGHRTGLLGHTQPPCAPERRMVTDGNVTPRELEVLHGIRRGKSNPEIGQELGIAADTVKVHVKNLFRKLDVADRSAAVDVGWRTGLLDGDQS